MSLAGGMSVPRFIVVFFVSSSLYPLSSRMLSILKILNSSSESVANSLLQILPNREKTRQHVLCSRCN